jgi:GNAT superfamily N-acetyltransferase
MPYAKRIDLEPALLRDAPELAELHTAVAAHLTSIHGKGPWSSETTEKGVLFALRNMRVFVARRRGRIIATLRLTTKKPWAIDKSYFSRSSKPVYLLAMAVAPELQRQGLGRKCLEAVTQIARAWPADAIRLDAYHAKAGAGPFYAKCGYTEVGRVTYRNCPLIYYEQLLS